MSTALLVLTDDDVDDELLEAAARYATGTDTELLVCRFVDRQQYQSEARSEARDGKQLPTVDMIESEAKEEAAAVADDAFGDADVSYTGLGAAGELPDRILDVAATRECEHLFVTGRGRSPTGKALFGDIAQTVLLRFDGPTTITTN